MLVKRKKGESNWDLIKRFQDLCFEVGLVAEILERRYFKSESQRKREHKKRVKFLSSIKKNDNN